mmetsp:Transcript_113072/g.200485  ORF Transcript_113072/g.200485 Transcript_113072/m.200485 type:complete len:228 (+) Transcript_113072:49-732(+)
MMRPRSGPPALSERKLMEDIIQLRSEMGQIRAELDEMKRTMGSSRPAAPVSERAQWPTELQEMQAQISCLKADISTRTSQIELATGIGGVNQAQAQVRDMGISFKLLESRQEQCTKEVAELKVVLAQAMKRMENSIQESSKVWQVFAEYDARALAAREGLQKSMQDRRERLGNQLPAREPPPALMNQNDQKPSMANAQPNNNMTASSGPIDNTPPKGLSDSGSWFTT